MTNQMPGFFHTLLEIESVHKTKTHTFVIVLVFLTHLRLEINIQ